MTATCHDCRRTFPEKDGEWDGPRFRCLDCIDAHFEAFMATKTTSVVTPCATCNGLGKVMIDHNDGRTGLANCPKCNNA